MLDQTSMRTEKVRQPKTNKSQKTYVQWVEGGRNHSVEIGEFLSLGRDSRHRVHLNNPFVSANHARLEQNSDGQYIVRDLHSQNGVLLNGSRVKEAMLRENDCIQLGEQKLYFRIHNFSNQDTYLTSKNSQWQTQLNSIPQIALARCPVLIMGPSGTGKERLAHLVHEMSRRSSGPFVAVNAGALSQSLIESELFGHKKGAFTGADQSRKGAFEAARGGTLFLDEIGDLPLDLQPKFLRAIENQEIRPLGADHSVKTDVRIVAATHKNLKSKVKSQDFRQDLFYRLNTICLTPPHLYERMEDFETLLYHFAREFQIAFSLAAIRKMQEHSWPGNIRELRNSIEKASILFKGQRLQVEHVNQIIDEEAAELISHNPELHALSKQRQKDLIVRAMTRNGGHQTKAAEELGIPRSTLSSRIQRYGLTFQRPSQYRKKSSAVE